MLDIKFDGNSIRDIQARIKQYQKLIKIVNEQFIIESLEWIRDKANDNLEHRVGYFAGTLNLREYWQITKTSENTYELRNTNEKGAYVEFGTGIVGSENSHPDTSIVGWKYDTNKHGEKGWHYFKDGAWHWTQGMPSRPFMYNTASELRSMNTIADIAREVFGSD